MAASDFSVSKQSRPILEPYARLSLSDVRRVQLFSFLAEAVDDPNAVAFEQDDAGLRMTWLDDVTLAWTVDIANHELDVIDVWDETYS